MVWSSKSKDPTYILTTTSSDLSRPVGPVHPTGRTGRHHSAASTGHTGPTDWSDRSAQPVRPICQGIAGSDRFDDLLRVLAHSSVLARFCVNNNI